MREDLEQRLRRHLPNLDAAAIPTKCEVFTICGSEARDLHDAIEEATALISAARKGQGEWRGIESAPKDGTPVDLWVEIVDEAPSSFDLEHEAHRVPNTYYADYRWFGGEWPWKPTHWMPLPPPPEQGE